MNETPQIIESYTLNEIFGYQDLFFISPITQIFVCLHITLIFFSDVGDSCPTPSGVPDTDPVKKICDNGLSCVSGVCA